jgi:hypothetical protein
LKGKTAPLICNGGGENSYIVLTSTPATASPLWLALPVSVLSLLSFWALLPAKVPSISARRPLPKAQPTLRSPRAPVLKPLLCKTLAAAGAPVNFAAPPPWKFGPIPAPI